MSVSSPSSSRNNLWGPDWESDDIPTVARKSKLSKEHIIGISIEGSYESRRPSRLESLRAFGQSIHSSWPRKNSHYSKIELGPVRYVSPDAAAFLDKDACPPPLPRNGWRKGILWTSAVTAVILLFNIIFLSVSVGKYGTSDGVGTLFQGDCGQAWLTNSALHVAINILSTVLLGASNYAMQVLSAPTRHQVDRAHAAQTSLLIGVPNMKNLGWIGPRRVILWLLLAVSTLPLHLLWNSAIFSTLQSNQYDVLIVSNKFVESNSFDCNLQNLNRTEGSGTGGMDDITFCKFAMNIYASATAGSMEILDNEACMKAYSVDFLSDRRNLLAVSSINDSLVGTNLRNGSVFAFMESDSWQNNMLSVARLPNSWICSSPDSDYSHTFYSSEAKRNLTLCDTDRAVAGASDWKLGPDNIPIDYCMSEKVPEVCRLQFMEPLLILVIVCNVIELACLLSAIHTLADSPLVVIGDAITSFLEKQDKVTDGQCLTVAQSNHQHTEISKIRGFWSIKRYQLAEDGMTRLWSLNRNCWFTATGSLTWIACNLLSVLFLGIASAMFVAIVSNLSVPLSFMNFTSPQSSTLLRFILITNAPQLMLSVLYFLYNTLYTSMLSASEMIKYSKFRRLLRVSYPNDMQRSTYWLQLPFKYSIPLLVSSSALHYLISQSWSILRVYFFDAHGQPINTTATSTGDAESNIVTLPGYSPRALIAAIILGSVMLTTLVAIGLRKFDADMPVLGNDSWAISAACHPTNDPGDSVYKGLQWGLVAVHRDTAVGRCCFTNSRVEPPVVGGKYA